MPLLGVIFPFSSLCQSGVLGVFSDWPATTTFFANCMNIGMHHSYDNNESTSSVATGDEEEVGPVH